MDTLLPRKNGRNGGPSLPSAPTKDELLRRTELLAQAEAQATLATDHARLAELATSEDLLALPVVGAAMEEALSTEAAACERWGRPGRRRGGRAPRPRPAPARREPRRGGRASRSGAK
jgi:hypothetical protein